MNLSFDPPLKDGDKPVTSATLSEPLVRHVLAAENARAKETGSNAGTIRNLHLIAEVTGLHVDLVKQFPLPQFNAANAHLRTFFAADEDGKQRPSLDPFYDIEVEPPVEKHNKRLDLLELKPPTAGQLELAQRELGQAFSQLGYRKFQVMLVALCAGQPRPLIEALRISTLEEAARYCQGFI